ncbi:MAG: HAMP domain-containing sensor histidine kinase [Myxococcales bacterium]
MVAALSLVLFQVWQGRSLRRRLAELSVHVDALRKGNLEHTLTPEAAHDELSALRAVLTQATFALKQARDGKERLLADAAHELRTPLTLMRTSLDLALRRERPMSELKAALADTRVEVDRLAALASRLLDTAAVAHQTEPRQSCDVAEIARSALGQITAASELRHLDLELRAEPEVWARVRPHALRQALDNLLSNAIKYAAHRVQVEIERGPSLLTLRVKDDGPGIPTAEREHVFEPFHRLKHSDSGAGLGLAIVREVALAHGGRAFVEPSQAGAALVLELDLAAA